MNMGTRPQAVHFNPNNVVVSTQKSWTAEPDISVTIRRCTTLDLGQSMYAVWKGENCTCVSNLLASGWAQLVKCWLFFIFETKGQMLKLWITGQTALVSCTLINIMDKLKCLLWDSYHYSDIKSLWYKFYVITPSLKKTPLSRVDCCLPFFMFFLPGLQPQPA